VHHYAPPKVILVVQSCHTHLTQNEVSNVDINHRPRHPILRAYISAHQCPSSEYNISQPSNNRTFTFINFNFQNLLTDYISSSKQCRKIVTQLPLPWVFSWLLLQTVAVFLRFEARRLRKAGIKIDDYTIVTALVCSASAGDHKANKQLNRCAYLASVFAILLVISTIFQHTTGTDHLLQELLVAEWELTSLSLLRPPNKRRSSKPFLDQRSDKTL
jgi:hypothetical protein